MHRRAGLPDQAPGRSATAYATGLRSAHFDAGRAGPDHEDAGCSLRPGDFRPPEEDFAGEFAGQSRPARSSSADTAEAAADGPNAGCANQGTERQEPADRNEASGSA